jgi:hypothetical protein
MPIELDKIPEPLEKAVKTGNLVPFIGAGVSRQAVPESSPLFPNWTDLLIHLTSTAASHRYITPDERKEIDALRSKGKHLMAAQALKNFLPDTILENVMRDRFGDPAIQPAPIHRRLFDLKPALILTTNYDLLLETAYLLTFREQATAWTFKDAVEVEHFLKNCRHWVQRPPIFKIHGTVARPKETILAERDYRNLRYREHGYRAVLSAIFVTKVVLMLGFSFSDPEIAVLTESLRESLDHRSSHDYILIPEGEKGPVEKRRLLDDFGLEVIEYVPTNNHSELLTFVDHLVKLVPQPAERLAATT